MPKSKRSSRAVMLQRTSDTYTLLLKGTSRKEIIQYAQEEWDIGSDMADRYIAKANKFFEERTKVQRDTELGQALERYEMLFQKAFKVQDYKTCIQAQSRIDKIMGLEVNRLEHTGKDGNPITHTVKFSNLSDDELDDLIRD